MKKILSLFAIVLIASFSKQTSAQTVILTGFENGSYYQMGKDMQKVIDSTYKIIPSEGNYANFMKLRNMKKEGIHVVFLQYDVLYAGSYGFEEIKKIQNIQALLPLGKEDIHLVTRKDSKINSIADLNGKTVDVGGINQGTAITARFIKDAANIKWKQKYISFDDSFTALMSGEIDAFFFVGSAPVKKFNELDPKVAASIKLVPVVDPDLEKLYSKTIIKAGTYSWLKEDIQTIAVGYALATNITDQTPVDINRLENLLKGIKENISTLRAEGHPAWKSVDFNFNKVPAPIHNSAKKIFGIE